jgi:hypothetical protein
MAVSGAEEVRRLSQLELMGHLFRRGGFGATRDELEAALGKGYEATLEELLHPEQAPDLEEDLLFRSFPDFHETRKVDVAAAAWVWRMIHTQRPLEEKMVLFWHGRFRWEFEFRPDRHDDSEKAFLGDCGHPNREAIEYLASVYHESQYDIRAMLRALFMSPFFRSEQAYYAKVKSSAEHVVGIMRLVGDYASPKPGFGEISLGCRYMGQNLLNPPSVEGWHVGKEWIDTGCLVERVNFGAKQLGDVSKPGVQRIIERLRAQGELSPAYFVDGCLDLLDPLTVNAKTRAALVKFVSKDGPLRLNQGNHAADQRVGELLSLIAATREFQMA